MLPGTRLGPYEILDPLGAGGMGEVYRGRDTRLDRPVAIKVTKDEFSERFQRETRAISALNHPNVCTLYDVGPNYLVMELVEGQSLAALLAKGALSVDLVLRYGAQVAGALSAAHAKGITHRDLKPANIMIAETGVKVLDFGLAKFRAQPDETVTASHLVVGTPAYMAPEQIEGRECDARTDVFALGLVLREMATGKRTHIGYGQPDALTDIPQRLALVIERCLMRNPDERWQSAADVKGELEWVGRESSLSQPAGAAPGSRPITTWIVATTVGVLVVGAVIGFVVTRSRVAAEPPRALQLSVNPPLGATLRLEAGSAISPDGRLLAFIAAGNAANRIWVRPLDGPAARELPGTDGATYPFWSPDSKSIGFFASGKLKRTDASGGLPIALCDVASGRGGTWNADGLIVFNGYNDGPLLQVAATGGEPKPLTAVDTATTENSHRWPQFLPDGRQLLFVVRADDPQKAGVYLSSLDHPQEKTRLVAGRTSGWYASGANGQAGHLLWVANDRLIAQPFDPLTGTLTGDAVPFADGPFVGANSNYFFSASNAGTLFYEKAPSAKKQLTWYTRDGKPAGVIGSPDAYSDGNLRLSPDGRQVALQRQPDNNIWLMDLERGIPRPLTTAGGTGWPVWSPTGDRVAYARGGPVNLFVKKTDAADAAERLTSTPNSQIANDWSADGFLLYQEQSNKINAQPGYDLWVLPVAGDKTPLRVAQGAFLETDGRFSPDGRWLSYTSDESGSKEIWVQQFPGGAAKTRVSSTGGDNAVWRRDGSELVYRSPDGTLMSVAVRTSGASLTVGVPAPLFKITDLTFDVARDGRILTLTPAEDVEASALTVVINWQAKLRRPQ